MNRTARHALLALLAPALLGACARQASPSSIERPAHTAARHAADGTMAMDMPMPPSKQQSTAEFVYANHAMHEGMAIEYSGNPDQDFLRGMIPHHQGAIDMARIELKYGKDPRVRELAQRIVDAQEQEIAMMHSWLQARPAVAPSPGNK